MHAFLCATDVAQERASMRSKTERQGVIEREQDGIRADDFVASPSLSNRMHGDGVPGRAAAR